MLIHDYSPLKLCERQEASDRTLNVVSNLPLSFSYLQSSTGQPAFCLTKIIELFHRTRSVLDVAQLQSDTRHKETDERSISVRRGWLSIKINCRQWTRVPSWFSSLTSIEFCARASGSHVKTRYSDIPTWIDLHRSAIRIARSRIIWFFVKRWNICSYERRLSFFITLSEIGNNWQW